MRPWLLVLVACGTEVAPEPAPAMIVAPAIHPVELVAQLRALGTRVAATQATPSGDDDIPAFAPCRRPTGAEREAIHAQITAWAHGEPDQVRFGCVEAAGAIVLAQRDRATTGAWWALRVSGRVRVLAEVTGAPTSRFMEWTAESTLDVIALDDLDGDGVLDVIATRDDHEGGASLHDLQLFAVTADGKRHDLARFGDAVTAMPNGALRIVDSRRAAPAYRCVRDFTLAYCPADVLAPLVAADRAAEAAAALARLDRVPDRDRLDELLAALGIHDRAELLASAPPAPAPERAARRVRSWIASLDPADLTRTERDTARRDAAVAHLAAIRDALGDADCQSAPTSTTTRAWARTHDKGTIAIAGRCRYAIVDWTRRTEVGSPEQGTHTRAIVWGAHVLAEASADGFLVAGPWGDAAEPALAATFVRHGASDLAVIDTGAHAVTLAVDGVIVGTRDGVERYVADDLQADGIVMAGDTAWHATPEGLAKLDDTDPAARLIATRVGAARARALLAQLDGNQVVARRAEILAALATLNAPAALVDDVRAAE